MLDLLFTGKALWFSIPAVIGTGLFLIRFGLMFLGGADFDIDDAGDADLGHHDDSSGAFKVLSIQTIAAFAMGFGWGGIGARFGTNWPEWAAVPVGIFCGVAMVWVLALLLKAAHDLQTSGNVLIRDAIGADGTVYVEVPSEESGRGQVQLVLNNRQRMFNAVTRGPAIASRTRIKVVGVNDDNTLTVEATI